LIEENEDRSFDKLLDSFESSFGLVRIYKSSSGVPRNPPSIFNFQVELFTLGLERPLIAVSLPNYRTLRRQLSGRVENINAEGKLANCINAIDTREFRLQKS